MGGGGPPAERLPPTPPGRSTQTQHYTGGAANLNHSGDATHHSGGATQHSGGVARHSGGATHHSPTGPAALSINPDHYYRSQMVPPWQWCRSDCASQQVRCAFRRPTRCAGLPDTLHGTTPAYQAKDASLCSLSAAISTAQANQGGSQHGDRATIIMSPPGSPKPSWGGYWGSWPFGQIYEKCTLRSLGLLGERRMHTGVQLNDPDRATAQSQAFTAPSKSGGYRV